MVLSAIATPSFLDPSRPHLNHHHLFFFLQARNIVIIRRRRRMDSSLNQFAYAQLSSNYRRQGAYSHNSSNLDGSLFLLRLTSSGSSIGGGGGGFQA